MKALAQRRRDDQENEREKLTEESRQYMSIRTITEPAVDIRKATKVVQLFFQAIPGGKTLVVEADTPVDVPRFRMARADQFERSWHLAAWVPNDPEGPTVRVNVDSPILEEVVTFHQTEYPDV
jgi:hypothetical protein